MASFSEHQQAADAAAAARDAADADEDRERLDRAWAHHVTAARQVRLSADHAAAALASRRSANVARSKGRRPLSDAHRTLADKLDNSSKFLLERAELNAGRGAELMRAVMTDPPAKPEPASRRTSKED